MRQSRHPQPLSSGASYRTVSWQNATRKFSIALLVLHWWGVKKAAPIALRFHNPAGLSAPPHRLDVFDDVPPLPTADGARSGA